jgi:hypothetical protein
LKLRMFTGSFAVVVVDLAAGVGVAGGTLNWRPSNGFAPFFSSPISSVALSGGGGKRERGRERSGVITGRRLMAGE